MTQENEPDLSTLSDQTKAEMAAGKVSLAKHEANLPKVSEPELPPDPELVTEPDPPADAHQPELPPVEEFKPTPPAFTAPLKKKK